MGEPIALEGRLWFELFSAVPHESKSVPQRLKSSSAQTITLRLNPCPSFDSLCPSLSGAVQIGQPKNLFWTGVIFSRPFGTGSTRGSVPSTACWATIGRPRSTSSGQALRGCSIDILGLVSLCLTRLRPGTRAEDHSGKYLRA